VKAEKQPSMTMDKTLLLLVKDTIVTVSHISRIRAYVDTSSHAFDSNSHKRKKENFSAIAIVIIVDCQR